MVENSKKWAKVVDSSSAKIFLSNLTFSRIINFQKMSDLFPADRPIPSLADQRRRLAELEVERPVRPKPAWLVEMTEEMESDSDAESAHFSAITEACGPAALENMDPAIRRLIELHLESQRSLAKKETTVHDFESEECLSSESDLDSDSIQDISSDDSLESRFTTSEMSDVASGFPSSESEVYF